MKMGSILVEVPSQQELSVDISPEHKNDENSFRRFEIVGIASEQGRSPTSLREEVVLLSWLLVLLRTREGQISYNWAYKDRGDIEHELRMRCLAMGEVMPGPQGSVGEVAATIARHITNGTPNVSMSSPASMILSTSANWGKPDEKDEVSKVNLFPIALTDRIEGHPPD